MEKKNHSGTYQQVYRKLREEILHLELPPGTSIGEIETAARFQTSRTPVRDAFKILEIEGLLEIKPHIGTFVSLIDLRTVSDILYMRCTLEQSIFRELSKTLNKSQEYKICLLLQKQKELLESDIPLEEMARTFIVYDNEFHYSLYELAGRKNISLFYAAVNSQYERFRTFINLAGKNELQRLYNEHEQIWDCIVNKDLEALDECISHHLYDGFNSSMKVIRDYPDYFTTSE
ncbi:MAG: GntR family transcriptional regulator [Lachnospiraceae bacterium]|nr:GntR family transcriptional regulator [Lachnospiraceae bacterium]